mmetsp:Transcript_15196/g.7385  ORF Transcript_15196/g.7385 Transcript_15196/m.7385 type:complete len:81 (-) Transcript_15196:209-451(-)
MEEDLQIYYPSIERLISNIQEENKIPGIGIGIIVNNQLLWSKGFGRKDENTNHPIDSNTIFRCASISKSFTSLMMLQLRN